jgi:transposase
MNDSHWIATLHRFGLIRPSFIPPGEFQRMRLLSRHRTNLKSDLVQVKNRVQKVLEDGNVKFSVIASDVFGVSGLNVLTMIAEGVKSPERLIQGITTKIKRKEEARKALTNTLTAEHCWLVGELMQQYKDIQTRISRVDAELAEKVRPYAHLIEELRKIPGIDTVTAIGVIAEATTNMRNFADERKFAAWAGVAAGNNESAGKKKDQGADTAIRH